MGLRGNDNVQLPVHMTKRGLYGNFCTARGWTLTTSALGNINFEKKEDEAQVLCSWHTFNAFWKKYYPTIKLSNPGADVCDACHLFKNRMKYKVFCDADEDVDSVNGSSVGSFYLPKTKGYNDRLN